MKRISVLLLVLILSFGLSACSSNKNDMISKAVNELKNHWKETYEEMYDRINIETDRYFEIKNTRVISIKENDTDVFKDIDYIIEFVLYTDRYGSAPYYPNVGMYDNVVVFKDGSMEVQSTVMQSYIAHYYIDDLPDIIKSIDDYSDKYNCVENLK